MPWEYERMWRLQPSAPPSKKAKGRAQQTAEHRKRRRTRKR